MGTSRSDPPAAADLEGLRLPATATHEEAAAVAAAISSYLAEARAAANGDEDRGWAGRRWGFAGRLSSLGLPAARVPDGAPPDGWAAAGRADRF